MKARARKERWVLRERRRCQRNGFCRFCTSPRLWPLVRATQELVGSAVFRDIAQWVSTGEEELFRRIFPEVAAGPDQSASSVPGRPGTGH